MQAPPIRLRLVALYIVCLFVCLFVCLCQSVHVVLIPVFGNSLSWNHTDLGLYSGPMANRPFQSITQSCSLGGAAVCLNATIMRYDLHGCRTLTSALDRLPC